MDYSRNSIYFTGNLSGAGCFGVLLLLAGIGTIWSGDASSGIVGLIIVIVGSALLAWGYSSSGSGMTDTEYDSAIAKYAESLKSRAYQKLGIDEDEVNEIAPIILGGYDFEGADKVKEGQDKQCRSNSYKVIMLFFSRNKLHGYTIRFKTTEDLILGEATDVYFYQDIVSASTASVSNKVKINDKEITINAEAFKLTTKGGTSLTVNVIDTSHIQESINAMRALLREKKQS